MKSILMTTSAVLLVTGFAAGQARAACPEDIDAFNREYEETLQNTAAGEALSTSEQAQLFGLKTAAENLDAAGNAEMCAAVIERANLILESAVAPQVIKPDELIGREVVNGQDENLGEIEEVMIDPVSGRIAYVIIEHGGFLGIGDDLFAVPWGALRFVPGNEQTLQLDIPEDKLENAPRFSRDDESPLERREWVTSVHNYYGVQPYWQDDVGAAAMQYGGGMAAAPAAGGQPRAQAGAAPTGETTTIVVPITQSGADDQSQTATQTEQPASEAQSESESQPEGEAQPGSEAQPDSETQPEQQTGTDSQSEAAQPAGASNLVAAQPPADAPATGGGVEALMSRMDQLEQQIQSLSEHVPGEKVTQSISRLEEQVQQLAQQVPGEELQQQIARIEEQLATLADTGGAGAAQESGTQGEPAAVVIVPDQSTQQPQPAEQQTEQAGEQQGGQQQGGQQQPGQEQAEQAGQPPAAEQQAATGAAQGQQEAVVLQQPAEEAAAGGTPCEELLAQLEEDLQRAEQLGVAIDDAESEYQEAQAMLNNNSEALCRAAIKRAHDELVAVGFEPTELN